SAETPLQLRAYELVYFRNIRAGWSEPGADRPDRFIGHDRICAIHAVRQRSGQLPPDDVKRAAAGALLLRLADADDRNEASTPCSSGLGPHVGVVLMVQRSPLGVPHNDRHGTGVLEHFG